MLKDLLSLKNIFENYDRKKNKKRYKREVALAKLGITSKCYEYARWFNFDEKWTEDVKHICCHCGCDVAEDTVHRLAHFDAVYYACDDCKDGKWL